MLLAEGLSSVDGIGLSDHPIFVNRKVNVENCINQALFSGKDQAIFSNLYGLMALCIAVMSDNCAIMVKIISIPFGVENREGHNSNTRTHK